MKLRALRRLVLCGLIVAVPVTVGCGDPNDTKTKPPTGTPSKVIMSGKKNMVADKAD